MSEAEFLTLINGMTETEQAELMNFIDFLLKCQEERRTVTDQEAREMGIAAKNRISNQQ